MAFTMDRRLTLCALACLPVATALAQVAPPRPRHKISAARLHGAVSERFPLRVGVEGLLGAQVSAPALLLLPRRNLLGATLQAQFNSLHLQQPQTGEVDVVFALRYEPADQTVRAHGLEVLDVRSAALPADILQALRRVLPALAREAFGEVVLQKLSARDLALADTMGFEPQKLTVLYDGLMVEFGPKQQR
jgi:hypothetical protein